MGLNQRLEAALQARQQQHLYRQRKTVTGYAEHQQVKVDGRWLVNFCSNDYLGLRNHAQVATAMQQAASNWGAGSGASHLVCGHSDLHHQLEQELATFTGRDRALLFSTGYMANLALLTVLTAKGDLVLQDRLNHASLLDGSQLSGCQWQRYQHADIAHLASKLTNSTGRQRLIATDAVFSMDGDIAPLPDLVMLAQQHEAVLMVDDAHGFGVLGQTGAGSAEHFNLPADKLPIYMATLGKAVGGFGAFVAGSETLIESLIQFARPYIYTTALPPAIAAGNLASLQIIREEPSRRKHLQNLINYFKQGAAAIGLPLMPSDTAIQPLMLQSSELALAVSQALENKGFWVTAIRPPTVPQHTARLRITLTATHTTAQLDALLVALSEVCHAKS